MSSETVNVRDEGAYVVVVAMSVPRYRATPDTLH